MSIRLYCILSLSLRDFPFVHIMHVMGLCPGDKHSTYNATGVDLGFDMSSANSRILPKKGGSGVLRRENLKSRSSLSGISFIFREFNYSKVQNKQVIKCCKNIIHTLFCLLRRDESPRTLL